MNSNYNPMVFTILEGERGMVIFKHHNKELLIVSQSKMYETMRDIAEYVNNKLDRPCLFEV